MEGKEKYVEGNEGGGAKGEVAFKTCLLLVISAPIYVFIRSCAEEDVEGHVVTKTTRIVQKTAPEEGSFLALIHAFVLYTISEF